MMDGESIAKSLQMAERTLTGHSESPRLDAEVLLGKVLGLSRTGLIVRGAEPIADVRKCAYEALLARRLRGAPVAYLTGSREFWSMTLTVTPDVLVPRPETELLVERALQLLPADQPRSVLDLGTGSGAIALAIAIERPRTRVTASDICAKALAVAELNARDMALSRIRWRLGAWFDAVPGERFDVIIANAPYVAAGDPALRLLAAEPTLALVSGPTGLEALHAIIDRAALFLKPHGALLLEHGSSQADDVVHRLELAGFAGIRSHVDYSGRPRVTVGSVNSSHQEYS